MIRKRTILIGLLVAAGVYAQKNASLYAHQLDEAKTDAMIKALTNPLLLAGDGSVAATRQRSGNRTAEA